MFVKEKLIELLTTVIFVRDGVDPAEAIADFLIDNGVTVQQWIPTSERLPTEGDANEDGDVLAVWIGGKVMDPSPKICGGTCAQYWGYVAQHTEYFSHWMSFPKPPKEV